jgi:uncharacterized protein YcfL
MKNVLVLGVAALALVGCAKNEEVAAPEAAPAVEATTPAPEAAVEAAPAADAAAPVEPGVTTEVKAAE